MIGVHKVQVEISAAIGWRDMPLGEVLSLGRGAVIELTRFDDNCVEVRANGHAVARGALSPAGAGPANVTVSGLIAVAA